MDYRKAVEIFIDREESYGNIINRGGVTVGLLRKFAVFLEEYSNQEKKQKPEGHILGCGCPLCRQGHWESSRR